MTRRGLIGGLTLSLLLPDPAAAQAQGAPPALPPGGGVPLPPPTGQAGAAAPARPRVVELRWDEIPPRRRLRLQERLAGPGNPPLAPDEARRIWDGMTPQQRRAATRRQPGEPRPARPRRSQNPAAPGGMPPSSVQ